ncbi:MAG: low specificity L-threonine aldolase [Synergistaceae bacterium]|nr:low specificity L-threonine aldolase [Synergistaceae bacterium]
MIRFESDYQEGCHPLILERLRETNGEQTSGYGVDPHCERAKALIRKAVGVPGAEVHFLVGGTQTNATVIKSLLRPCEGVVCAESGHINVHESGAIEATGHKVLTLPARGGLLDAADLKKYMEDFNADPTKEHTVQPGMVYISHPSECGTLYTRSQLEALHAVCAEYDLPLFLDGARLGYGVMAPKTDVTLQDVARLCDVFYIGGTKVGALFGEAVAFPRPGTVKNFRALIKQQGGLLAKGRLLGIQFEVLFEDRPEGPLYFEIARHADEQAMRIRGAFEAKGIPLLHDSVTNQQFPILTGEQYDRLAQGFSFELWGRREDGRRAARFCTSWTTPPENVDALISAIKDL